VKVLLFLAMLVASPTAAYAQQATATCNYSGSQYWWTISNPNTQRGATCNISCTFKTATGSSSLSGSNFADKGKTVSGPKNNATAPIISQENKSKCTN